MKTRFFKVAQSGKTVDGREITPAQIDQMAKNYDPAKYGARVNLEHYLSFMPDSAFKAYGDVLAVKSEAGPDGSRVLLAQIDATPDLMKLSADRQKVYWSIEMHPNFAGSGDAYLMGLAMTDTPASLGTEMLNFALKSDKLSDEAKARLYSCQMEGDKADMAEDKPAGPGILDTVKTLLSGKAKGDDARFGQTDKALETIAAELGRLKEESSGKFADAATLATLATKLDKLSTDLADVTTKLANTPANTPRPLAGGGATHQTDC